MYYPPQIVGEHPELIDLISMPHAQIPVRGTAAGSIRIREVWGSKIGDGARPQATLKIDPTATVGEGAVVIKSRSVASSHDASTVKLADYELLNEIGQGGMGIVYAARQASFNRRVAIKMLRPGVQGKQHEFVSEAVTTGDLDHPNIVPVYDLGSNDDGALFYAMKCVQGTPWDDALPTKSRAENLAILMKVADAIAFAHAKGVVHRDLKPENIMLGSFGEVLVMDWGLAVRFTVEPDGQIHSAKTTMGGTPAYMAPELVLGPMERIGPAADVYLLGAILFEIVTGRPPHSGKSAMECLQAAANNVIEPTDCPDELLGIALKAMQTEPKDRYGSVTAFQRAVQEYQSHSESIALLNHAREQLARARQTDDYAQAVFPTDTSPPPLPFWSPPSGGRGAADGNKSPAHRQRRPAVSGPDSRIGYQTTISSLWPIPVADAGWLDAAACQHLPTHRAEGV